MGAFSTFANRLPDPAFGVDKTQTQQQTMGQGLKPCLLLENNLVCNQEQIVAEL